MPIQQKIILVDGSRLLRGMLKRAIERDAGLRVVAEVDDFRKFSTVVNQTDADWLFLTLLPQKPIPEIIDKALRERPSLNLMVMATDGSQVRMRWVETHEVSLDEKNLEEILSVLHEKGKGEKLTERIGV